MSPAWYVYCFTWDRTHPSELGEGVDPRFPVQPLVAPPLAAVVSRVGLDRFDVAKLQPQTVDVDWLAEMAVRHHEVIVRAARLSPVLPLRLGTLFHSRESLLAKMSQIRPRLTMALEHLNGQQEWSVKIYHDGRPGTNLPARNVTRTSNRRTMLVGTAHAAHIGGRRPVSPGIRYLASKRQERQEQQELRQAIRREAAAVESALRPHTSAWRQLPPLSDTLTGAAQKMVWNATALVPTAWSTDFCALGERLHQGLIQKDLRLVLTGPWPPYHFCPEFSLVE